MAEKDKEKESGGAGASPDTPTPPSTPAAPQPPTTTEKTEPTRSASRGRAVSGGDYVVIADQVPLKDAKGDTFTVHRRGAKVKLTAAQATTLTGGTRPAVVPADDVKDDDVAGAAIVAIRRSARERSERRSRR